MGFKGGMKYSMAHPIQSFLDRLDKRPALAWVFSILWVLVIVGVAFWWNLGSTGLVDETEPLFAEAARQMTVTGDWITPYFDGDTRFDKPPLIYWLMALAYQTIGVNTWAVRFPSALAATILTAFGFYTLRRFGHPRPANSTIDASDSTRSRTTSHALWWSACIGSALIALNPQTIVWARTGVSDMLLSSCMGVALLAFFLGYAQPDAPHRQSRWYLVFYLFSALAVLTKGPVGIVLPGLIIVMFLAYTGQLKSVLREMRLLRGGLLFLAITLPWYILVTIANGEAFIDSFFGYHNFERFTRVVNNHSAPLLFYVGVVPIAMLPWSIYLPVALARLRFWQPQPWRQQPRSTHLGIFALVWLVVIFGFFTISVTKLPSYMIPLLPAVAILIALFWSDQITQARTSRPIWTSYAVNIVLFGILAIGLFYSPNWMGNEPEMPNLPDVMRQAGIPQIGGAIWLLAALIGLVLLLRRQGRWLWAINGLACLMFMILAALPTMTVLDNQRQLPLRQLAETIVQVQKPQETVLMVGYRKPSLVFYTHRSITYVGAPSNLSKHLNELAPQLAKPTSAIHSLLVLGRVRKIEEGGLTTADYQTLAETGVYRLGRLTFPPGQPVPTFKPLDD